MPRFGTGSVQLQGAAGLETSDGAISLRAGADIVVQNGFVRTTGGGNISVTALAGNVNAGTKPEGFTFSGTGLGYEVNSSALGGISTASGGDVSITAGQDIISFLPSGPSGSHSDGGTGAFGAEPGNVSLSSGRDIIGHYIVRNGHGIISAGRDAG